MTTITSTPTAPTATEVVKEVPAKPRGLTNVVYSLFQLGAIGAGTVGLLAGTAQVGVERPVTALVTGVAMGALAGATILIAGKGLTFCMDRSLDGMEFIIRKSIDAAVYTVTLPLRMI